MHRPVERWRATGRRVPLLLGLLLGVAALLFSSGCLRRGARLGPPRTAQSALRADSVTPSAPVTAPAPSAPIDSRVGVLSLNIGGGIRGRAVGECAQGQAAASGQGGSNVSDLSELFSRESARLLEAGADAVVIAMQEVDANTSRRPDDVPAHLTRDLQQTLRPTFAHRFLPAITLCPRGAPDWCIANPDQGARPEGCNACRGSFGVALIASDPFVEVREDRLAWYGRDAFDAAGARASRDFREHGMEPRVALAGRVRSAAGDLWVVSVHLGGEVAPSTPDEQIAVRHVAEVLEFVRSSLGTSVPVLVVGDFNLLRRGQHRTGDPRYASNGAGYEAMRNRFTEAGFVELGDTGSEPCWEVDRCTITPWGRYSAVDYAWLQDPSGRVRDARVDVVSPELAPGCFLTDHMMLRVELQLHSPGVDGE